MIRMTTWHRLEPRVRGGDPGEGLRAAIYDPLWLLGRQWQVGELLGEDAGSPVSVRVETEHYGLSRFRSAAGDVQPYDPDAVPLEALAEREPPPAPTLRDRLDAWSRLVLLLARAGLVDRAAGLAAASPLPPPRVAEDPAEARLRLIAGPLAGDGLAAAAALAADPAGLPADLVTAFVTWVQERTPAGAEDSWVSERMEYRFRVAADTPAGPLVLGSDEYPGGRLDWYDLDVDLDDAPDNGGFGPADGAAPPPSVVTHLLPARVTFPGMPNERFWAFEDAAVDLGAVSAAAEDLGRLLVVEFATVFGSDWWQVPVPARFGGLVGVRSLVVRDTFGENVLVEAAPTSTPSAPAAWRMFRLTDASPVAGSGADPRLLLLPPVVAGGLDGDGLEELLLLRDEMANLAWGVERVVEGADGRPRNRSLEYAAGLSAAPLPDLESPADLVYVLQTQVPEHWIPLVPVHDPAGTATILLQRGSLLTQDGDPRPVTAQGVLLSPDSSPWYLHQEEVPRAGRRIRRVPSVARWLGGETFSWVSRRSTAGSGEGSSGLRFDIAVRPADNARDIG